MKSNTIAFTDDFFLRHSDLIPIRDSIEAAAGLWVNTLKSGHKLLLCGNGGSCSDCDHIAGELLKGFLLKRPLPKELQEKLAKDYGEIGAELGHTLQQGLPVISLTAHSAAISAYANDAEPDYIYAQQVPAYGTPGDLLVGISTSGNAKNVNAAVMVANAMGLNTMALTGKNGGSLVKKCSLSVISPEKETYRIQEHHLAIYHLLCAVTEYELFDE